MDLEKDSFVYFQKDQLDSKLLHEQMGKLSELLREAARAVLEDEFEGVWLVYKSKGCVRVRIEGYADLDTSAEMHEAINDMVSKMAREADKLVAKSAPSGFFMDKLQR